MNNTANEACESQGLIALISMGNPDTSHPTCLDHDGCTKQPHNPHSRTPNPLALIMRVAFDVCCCSMSPSRRWTFLCAQSASILCFDSWPCKADLLSASASRCSSSMCRMLSVAAAASGASCRTLTPWCLLDRKPAIDRWLLIHCWHWTRQRGSVVANGWGGLSADAKLSVAAKLSA